MAQKKITKAKREHPREGAEAILGSLGAFCEILY
jgi:hypothetical protein